MVFLLIHFYLHFAREKPSNHTVTVTFDPIIVTSGNHTIRFNVIEVNNSNDEYYLNNFAESTFSYIVVYIVKVVIFASISIIQII